MGANFGAKSAVERARKEEMERLGVSQDMLDAAQDIGLALQQSLDGLDATRASLETQQSLARRLDRDATELYEKAKTAMSTSSGEDEARKLLLKRTEIQDKLKNVLVQCAAEKRRMETMEENVRVMEARALEIDALLQRTVGAKARQDASLSSSTMDMAGDFSLSREDPLLQKFRDLGIK
jgi:organic radical activating enzyme